MHRRHLWVLAFAFAPFAFLDAVAQQPKAGARPPARADSTQATDSTAADSTADDADEPEHRITSGVSVGGLSYEGGRSERATSAVLRWRALPWLSLGVTPTFSRATEPVGLLGRTASRSGLTDLPVEISADHAFDAPLSPSLGLGIGITLPVGDSASGFGSGTIGSSISVGGGLSLTDRLGVHVGAGRSLTDFSLQSSFNGTSSEYGSVGVSLQANDAFSMSAGLDGDIGAVDPDYGRAASLSGGVSIVLPYVNSVSLNASRGLSGATPSWSFAIGVGTDFASIGSPGSRDASARLHRAFGGGTHGLVARGAKKLAITRRKRP